MAPQKAADLLESLQKRLEAEDELRESLCKSIKASSWSPGP